MLLGRTFARRLFRLWFVGHAELRQQPDRIDPQIGYPRRPAASEPRPDTKTLEKAKPRIAQPNNEVARIVRVDRFQRHRPEHAVLMHADDALRIADRA